jgi:hypothetical protein
VGLISKKIHQRRTQQLLGQIEVASALSPAEVLTAVKRLVDSYIPETGALAHFNSSNHGYWLVEVGPTRRQIVCANPVKGSTEVPTRFHWIVGLEVSSSGEAGSTIRFGLIKWRTDDGALMRRDAFEQLRDRLIATLGRTTSTS